MSIGRFTQAKSKKFPIEFFPEGAQSASGENENVLPTIGDDKLKSVSRGP
jgi:hypothetical protein